MEALNKRHLGSVYEKAAGKHLENAGLKILVYNYRYRRGEIDIIAKDGEYYVFVEVKARRSESHGTPLDAVDTRKQRIIRRTAESYLYTNHIYDAYCRFDVIGISRSEDTGAYDIEWIKDAF